MNNFKKKSSSHTTYTWQIHDLNPEGLAPKPLLLAIALQCVSKSGL